MKSRLHIEKLADRVSQRHPHPVTHDSLILEVLLDIRDLLEPVD